MSKAELVGLHDPPTDGTTGADLIPRPTNSCWSHLQTNQPMLIKAELVGLHDQPTDGTTGADPIPRPTNWCWSHLQTNQPVLISDSDFTAASASVDVLGRSLITVQHSRANPSDASAQIAATLSSCTALKRDSSCPAFQPGP